jgi:hypothetical protein
MATQGLNTSSNSSSGYGYSQQQHNTSSSSWVSGGASKQAPPSIKDRSIPLGHHSSNTSDLYGSSFDFGLKLCDTVIMYGDNTSRSKNSLPGTSHGKTSSSHGTGSSNNPGTSHGSTKGAASRKGSPGGGSSEHLYGNSSYGNIMSGVDTSVGSVNSSMLGLQARDLYSSSLCVLFACV